MPGLLPDTGRFWKGPRGQLCTRANGECANPPAKPPRALLSPVLPLQHPPLRQTKLTRDPMSPAPPCVEARASASISAKTPMQPHVSRGSVPAPNKHAKTKQTSKKQLYSCSLRSLEPVAVPVPHRRETLTLDRVPRDTHIPGCGHHLDSRAELPVTCNPRTRGCCP